MNFEEVKAGMRIEYIGESWAFEGDYKVYNAEATYEPDKCPDDEKGKLLIVEFMNDDTPMFFTLERLDPKEWKLVIG